MEKISIYKNLLSKIPISFNIHSETEKAFRIYNFKNELFWIPKKALLKLENKKEFRFKSWFLVDNNQTIHSLFNQ
jgi:hypothetical protein